MTEIAEYDRHDGLGLAGLVRAGEVSPTELRETAVARAERLNPALNAIVTPAYEHARESAAGRLPEGPFTGVPFLLKDILHAWAGVPMSHGSAALRDYVPEHDAELVRRFRDAGLVFMGKTSTPELALMGVTEPEAFGPARNPWNTAHTPGGSSGGSAAAVAAGIVPLASGSDGGGSIRIPAACCGLFGLRPSRGRVPTGPYHREVWEGASSDHVLTRSVRDSAAGLDAIAGPDAGASLTAPTPERPFLDEVAREPGRLRIAFCDASPIGTPADPECVRAVRDAAELLESLGHDVAEARPAIDGQDVARAFLTMYFGQVAADLAWIRRIRGRRAARRVESTTRMLDYLGRALSAGEYVRSHRRWNDIARAMAGFHRSWDIYLTPTLAAPPARVGELQPAADEHIATRLAELAHLGRPLLASGAVDRLAARSLTRTPFTQLANLAGQPAMSVPLHWTPEGLPCGVQAIAPWGGEATLLRLAGQLERACPWFDRRPPPPAEGHEART